MLTELHIGVDLIKFQIRQGKLDSSSHCIAMDCCAHARPAGNMSQASNDAFCRYCYVESEDALFVGIMGSLTLFDWAANLNVLLTDNWQPDAAAQVLLLFQKMHSICLRGKAAQCHDVIVDRAQERPMQLNAGAPGGAQRVSRQIAAHPCGEPACAGPQPRPAPHPVRTQPRWAIWCCQQLGLPNKFLAFLKSMFGVACFATCRRGLTIYF